MTSQLHEVEELREYVAAMMSGYLEKENEVREAALQDSLLLLKEKRNAYKQLEYERAEKAKVTNERDQLKEQVEILMRRVECMEQVVASNNS